MDSFITGKSEQMHRVLKSVKQYAESDIPIIIMGETGTGKTHLAQIIHALSGAKGLLLKFDCATLNPKLIESELFGHEKGAFTGANEKKIGLLDMAGDGTLLLDEIENIKPKLQEKLLGVLEDNKFRRMGGRKEIEVSFRLIATTNKNPGDLIRKGLFRNDLYYRLKGFEIALPPLRERKEDIMEIARHFLGKLNQIYRTKKTFTSDVATLLLCYQWPGNIRELKYVVEKAVVTTENNHITPEDFDLETNQQAILSRCSENKQSLHTVERMYIEMVLKRENFNKSRAAKILGIGLSTLQRKLKLYENTSESHRRLR